jgi:hypothetical protein
MLREDKVTLVTAVTVRLIMAAFGYGIMLWAATEVSGILRWLLLGWVHFNVSVVFIAATVRQVKKELA